MYPYTLSRKLRLRGRDPYDPTQEELDLELGEVAEDEAGNQRLDLRGASTWRELKITLDAYLPEGELAKILVHPENAKDDAALVVSVRCAATKSRRVVFLAESGPGKWYGDVAMGRASVRSIVELEPFLVRRTRLPSEATPPGLATEPNVTIATGPSIYVVVDPAPLPTGMLRMTWEDFRASEDAWRKSHSDDLFYVDLADEQQPILFLNSSHAPFKAVLHSPEKEGMNAALRKAMNGWVSQVVWTQLFMAALGAVDADEELETVEPPSGWRGGVLDAFLPKMLPESSTPEERLRRAVEMRTAPDQVGQLVSRLAAAVAEVTKGSRLMREAVRAAEAKRVE